MSKERILVVDDEEDILELARYNLVREGYSVDCVSSGESALAAARKQLPDLILLDLMLPGIGGLDVCRSLRRDSKTSHIPIIMVTARGEDADVVAGLELGADDYVTKPFSPRILLARIRAVLRRRLPDAPDETAPIMIHDMVIHPARHDVHVAGQKIDLTATEFSILQHLARRPGLVFTRNQIINSVKGDDYPVTDRSVDVQVAGLRKKLGTAGDYIETIRGVGYRFKE